MKETSQYIFEKNKENEFESWKVTHNKQGGYTTNNASVKINDNFSLPSCYLYISTDDGSVYIAKEQVEWLRDILNEIDLGDE